MTDTNNTPPILDPRILDDLDKLVEDARDLIDRLKEDTDWMKEK